MGAEPGRKCVMDSGLIGTLDREEMAKEVAVRLAVRRKFYRSAFVVFAVAVVVPAVCPAVLVEAPLRGASCHPYRQEQGHHRP